MPSTLIVPNANPFAFSPSRSSVTAGVRETVIESFGSAFVGGVTGRGRIDEATSTVKHVKILGFESLNGRDYRKPIRSQQRLAALYEGAPVGVGHVKNADDNRNGSYGEFNGFLKNVAVEADGLYGDHMYNPEHPTTRQYLWDVRNNSKNLGFSQHADITRSHGPNGRQVVESIDFVHSVDLVNRPATTSGVFESASHGGRTQAAYDALLAETVQLRARKVLLESPVAPFETAADVLRFMRSR